MLNDAFIPPLLEWEKNIFGLHSLCTHTLRGTHTLHNRIRQCCKHTLLILLARRRAESGELTWQVTFKRTALDDRVRLMSGLNLGCDVGQDIWHKAGEQLRASRGCPVLWRRCLLTTYFFEARKG